MKFQSTRNKNLRFDSAETIIRGLSDDGGLFVPVEIPVLEKGEIIERGDHEQLLAQKGRYYNLYTLQYHKQQLSQS